MYHRRVTGVAYDVAAELRAEGIYWGTVTDDQIRERIGNRLPDPEEFEAAIGRTRGLMHSQASRAGTMDVEVLPFIPKRYGGKQED